MSKGSAIIYIHLLGTMLINFKRQKVQMEHIVGKIREIAEKSVVQKDRSPLLSRKNYSPILFSTENFHKIPPISEKSEGAIRSKTTFIDGGSAIILESMNFCLGFIRAHAVTYSGEKRQSSQTVEAYVLVLTIGNGEDITFKTEIIQIKGDLPFKEFGDLLSFDSLDETIRLGIRRSSPTAMVGIARRFAELHLAMALSIGLGKDDMIVLDGSLQQSYTNEELLLEKLRELSSNPASPAVIGFCKTNSVFTKDGHSFSDLLSSNQGRWAYFPVGVPINNSPHISYAKLHERSSYVFMMDSFYELKLESYSKLALYAHDPIFLGYPYGLIEADRAARVSMQESASLQFQLRERLGKSFETLSQAKNAHSVLDKISF